jgi:hypothetical protein
MSMIVKEASRDPPICEEKLSARCTSFRLGSAIGECFC